MMLRVKKVRPQAQLPAYAHEQDAGMDIRAAEAVDIAPGQRLAVPTGLAFQLPPGMVALVWDKSGRAVKDGLKTMAGVVDEGFTGEFLVVLVNVAAVPVHIAQGEKIAQVLIQKVEHVTIQEVDDVGVTQRGSGGFGSTGVA